MSFISPDSRNACIPRKKHLQLQVLFCMVSFLLLHDVDGETAILTAEVNIFDSAVLKVGGSVHVEGEALLLQLLHGGGKIRRAHGDVAVFAEKRRFHTFKVRTAELGFLPVAGFQVEHRGQQLRKACSLLGVCGIKRGFLPDMKMVGEVARTFAELGLAEDATVADLVKATTDAAVAMRAAYLERRIANEATKDAKSRTAAKKLLEAAEMVKLPEGMSKTQVAAAMADAQKDVALIFRPLRFALLASSATGGMMFSLRSKRCCTLCVQTGLCPARAQKKKSKPTGLDFMYRAAEKDIASKYNSSANTKHFRADTIILIINRSCKWRGSEPSEREKLSDGWVGIIYFAYRFNFSITEIKRGSWRIQSYRVCCILSSI